MPPDTNDTPVLDAVPDHRKVSVSFERKIDRGNYGNEVARVFVEGTVPAAATEAEIAEAANILFTAAKASVYDQLGIEFLVDEHGVLREAHTPPPAGDTGAQVQRAFGGGHEIRVMNQNDQQGPLPDWLIELCAANGITAVWDNRKTGRHFVEAKRKGEGRGRTLTPDGIQ